MPAPVSGPVVAACVARGRPQNPGPVPGGAGGPLALRRRALRPRRPPRRGGGLAALACRLLLGPLAVSLAVVGALAGAGASGPVGQALHKGRDTPETARAWPGAPPAAQGTPGGPGGNRRGSRHGQRPRVLARRSTGFLPSRNAKPSAPVKAKTSGPCGPALTGALYLEYL